MTRGNAQPRGRHHVGTLAGFKSERVAGFRLECMAGFVGIRTAPTLSICADKLDLELAVRECCHAAVAGA
jgi:hypothetical protein